MFWYFFPDASQSFVDELVTLFVSLVAATEQLMSHGARWHTVSGKGVLLLYRALAHKVSKMIEAYFGVDRMVEYASSSGSSVQQMSLGMTTQLVVGVSTVAKVAAEMATRLLENPRALGEEEEKMPYKVYCFSFVVVGSNEVSRFRFLKFSCRSPTHGNVLSLDVRAQPEKNQFSNDSPPAESGLSVSLRSASGKPLMRQNHLCFLNRNAFFARCAFSILGFSSSSSFRAAEICQRLTYICRCSTIVSGALE